MRKVLAAFLVLALTACSGMPPPTFTTQSDCSGGRESTYSCQIERYNKAGY